jgi:hypothetical protein
MGFQQMLLAGRGLIEPPYAVGAKLFEAVNSKTYPGNAVSYLTHDTRFPSSGLIEDWLEKTYRYTMQWTCSASYVCAAPVTQLFKNGVIVASWSEPADENSYFRSHTGTKTHTFDLSLQAGDYVQARMYGRGRNVGGTTPTLTLYHNLKRLT